MAKKNPALSAERLYETGHTFFASSAIEKQDPRAWYMSQQIALRIAQHQLDSQKYHDILAARKAAIEAQLKTAKEKGGISQETFDAIERELNLT